MSPSVCHVPRPTEGILAPVLSTKWVRLWVVSFSIAKMFTRLSEACKAWRYWKRKWASNCSQLSSNSSQLQTELGTLSIARKDMSHAKALHCTSTKLRRSANEQLVSHDMRNTCVQSCSLLHMGKNPERKVLAGHQQTTGTR